jgi:hypothetical protein
VNEIAVIQGPPGIRYEVTWGRTRMNSKTYIARVYECGDGGSMQLWACSHKHPIQAAAVACGWDWAVPYAEQQIAHHAEIVAEMTPENLLNALRQALPGVTSVTFSGEPGTGERTYDLRRPG